MTKGEGSRGSRNAPNDPNADTYEESEGPPRADRDDNSSSGQSLQYDTCLYASGPTAPKPSDTWTTGDSAGSLHDGDLWCTTVPIGAWWACLLPLYSAYAFASSTVGRFGGEFAVFLGLVELGLAAINSFGHNRLFWLVCLTVLAGQCVAAVPSDIPRDTAKDAHRDVGMYHVIDARRGGWQLAGGGGRPIPTPCRIRPPQHTIAKEPLPTFEHVALELDGPLRTLLESSREASSGHAFFLAHTLLDTLIEHFAESCCARPSALALSEYLPRCIQYDIDQVMLRIGKNFDDVVPILQGRWPLQTSLPIGLQLHPATAKALGSAHHNCDFDSVGIEVYTDGSFNGHISAWAFAVVELGCASRRLRGWWRGSVALKGDDEYIGAESHSAIEAERTALFWAIVWTLSHTEGGIKIWTDSISVIGQTSGKWGGTASSTLARACRAIAQAAETTRDVCFSAFCHVRAHQGDPYNELVDVLAKGHQLSCPTVPAPHKGLAGWVQDNTIEWIWLLCDAMRNPGQWPALHGPCLVDTARGQGKDVLDPRRALGLKPTATEVQVPSQPLCMHLSIVSSNVQTLEEDAANGLVGRVPYVREQLEWLGVCLTGLQETRAKTTETVVSDTHYRFLSAGDHKGCLGVELWVARRVPFATQGQLPLFFALEDFRVLSWSPRHLITKCVRGSLRFIITVCHAPIATDPGRDAWWRKFVDDVRCYAGDLPVVVIGDLNLRLTVPWESSIGDLCWEEGPDPPAPFFRLLEFHELWIPSTYTACHHGLSHAWSSPGHGSLSRIDYIAIPRAWQAGEGSSQVLYDVDFGLRFSSRPQPCLTTRKQAEASTPESMCTNSTRRRVLELSRQFVKRSPLFLGR